MGCGCMLDLPLLRQYNAVGLGGLGFAECAPPPRYQSMLDVGLLLGGVTRALVLSWAAPRPTQSQSCPSSS